MPGQGVNLPRGYIVSYICRTIDSYVTKLSPDDYWSLYFENLYVWYIFLSWRHNLVPLSKKFKIYVDPNLSTIGEHFMDYLTFS